MVLNWSVSDRKSPQVYRTLPSSEADLNNVVVWIVSAGPLSSNSFSLFTKPLGIVPGVPITLCITIIIIIMLLAIFSHQC